MKCGEVIEFLSAYYDGELSSDKSATVADHVAACANCAAELETLHKLSILTMKLDQPSPPRHIWQQIDSQLNRRQPTVVAARRASRKTLLAVAALLLVGLAWVAYTHWHGHEHHHLAMNFNHFLDTFEHAPDEAQRDLVKNYLGVPVEIPDAIRELKYRPVVADGLPADYEPVRAYLLKMPCCRCLEACFHRKDGGMLCVFEHDEDQPVWFGDRPTSSNVCSGKQTRIVQVDGSLAATWQHQRHHITVIGAKDVAEVSRLVAHLEQQREL